MPKVKNIFALNLDDNTREQFDHCCAQPFVVKAALMPDAHLGYVAPIGSVLITKDYIVPSWVGFDIGCGMTAVHIKGKGMAEKIKENSESIFASVQKRVPMGKGEMQENAQKITEQGRKEYKELVEKYKKKPYNKQVLQFLEGKAILHLGSLGSGNHFIEMGFDEKNNAWVVVHSGSRGVGYKVAEHYMKASAGKDKEFEKTYPLKEDSETGKEYLNILDFGLEFALLNRMEIIRKTIAGLEEAIVEKIEWELWVNKNHNHAVPENGFYIHRKGATPAKKGERGVIPGNMRDGCFLVEGFGNRDFLESSSHGAGRKYSRTDAQKEFTMEQFKESMKGIKGTVTEGTLDESPMVYKDIFDVMEAQKKSVKVIAHIKPLINWKGEKSRKGKKKEHQDK